jgi:predicted transcriptional regulator
MEQLDQEASEQLVTLTSEIVIAHVSRNKLATAELPAFITSVYNALAAVGAPEVSEDDPLTPAVPIRASVKNDHIICLEDGRKMKLLKRHLQFVHGLSPDEYRKRWSLPADYPMVPTAYADTRREFAKKSGLGKQPDHRRGRPKKTKP